MLKEFTLGITHFIRAGSLLSRHRLLHYYLYPVLLSLLLYIFLASWLLAYAQSLVELLLGPYLPERLPEMKGWWSFLNVFRDVSLYGLMALLGGAIVFLVFLKFSKYIVLIVLSPVFALLSEKVEEKLSGVVFPFSLLQFLKDAGRGILLALRNMLIEMGLIALFALLGLFGGPFALLLGPVLWIVGAYFYGFSMLDYACERRKMGIAESIRFMRRHRFFVLGNGIMYALLDAVPFLGLMVAPVNGVTGACSGLLELEASDASAGKTKNT